VPTARRKRKRETDLGKRRDVKRKRKNKEKRSGNQDAKSFVDWNAGTTLCEWERYLCCEKKSGNVTLLGFPFLKTVTIERIDKGMAILRQAPSEGKGI